MSDLDDLDVVATEYAQALELDHTEMMNQRLADWAEKYAHVLIQRLREADLAVRLADQAAERMLEKLQVNKEHDINQIRALQEDVARLERVRGAAQELIQEEWGNQSGEVALDTGLEGRLRAALAAVDDG